VKQQVAVASNKEPGRTEGKIGLDDHGACFVRSLLACFDFYEQWAEAFKGGIPPFVRPLVQEFTDAFGL
jgi:hypothetical protein